VSLAEELRAGGHDADVTPGGKGQFDIVADGDLVFSKHELGRFPDDGEVAGLLAGLRVDG
jgi:predicted Rdx family selenoprotein